MPEDHLPDLSGKHLHIYLSTRSNNSYLVQDAAFEIQAGRMFLVGRVSDAYEGTVWGRGASVAFAWDTVEQYMVFDSIDHYREELRRWRAAKAGKDKKLQSFGHWIVSPWSRKGK